MSTLTLTGGTVRIDVASATSYDVITTAGNAALGNGVASLELTAAAGYAPAATDKLWLPRASDPQGVTTTGSSIAEAVLRALNLEALASIILAAAQAAMPPDRPGRLADLPGADIADLPDLGATLNTESVWRYHLARLDHAGLGLTPGDPCST